MHDDTAHDHSPTAVEASEPTRATFQSRSRVKSNLSAEQLRQKRLVDRRAQQAFRERNKEKVRHLEQELNDLRAKWQSREKELLQDMQHIREQNETLLHRLRNIASLATTATDVDHAFPDAYDQGEAEVGNAADVIKSPSPRASSPQSSTVPQSERNTLPASALGDDIVALPDDQPPTDPRSASLLVPSTDVVPLLHSRTVAFDQGRTALAHFQDTDSRLTSVTANAAPVSPTSINNSAKVSPDRDPARLVSAILPLHLPPTCPLDHILLGCLQSNRSALSEGESPELVTGPERASVKRFIDQQPDSTTHAMSRVMSEVMSTYPSVGKAEQLALFYLMHQTMRWMAFPAKQSYEFMPEWLRPTVTQITVPHAAWIDNVPWPGVRDKIITYPEEYPYSLWTANFTQAVQVNWLYDFSDAWIESNGDFVLHSIFEKHVRNLKNWSVAPLFGQVFPDLMPIMLPNY